MKINELKLQIHKQNEVGKAIENINNMYSYEKRLNELKSRLVGLSMHSTPTNEISDEEVHSAQSKIIHSELQSIVHGKLSSKMQQEREEYDMTINNLKFAIKHLMKCM